MINDGRFFRGPPLQPQLSNPRKAVLKHQKKLTLKKAVLKHQKKGSANTEGYTNWKFNLAYTRNHDGTEWKRRFAYEDRSTHNCPYRNWSCLYCVGCRSFSLQIHQIKPKRLPDIWSGNAKYYNVISYQCYKSC